MSDKVVPIGQASGGGLTIKYKRQRFSGRCDHLKSVTLDENSHIITCNECGEIVDPIRMLVAVANHQRDIAVKKAFMSRPRAVQELLSGANNTQMRRRMLAEYLNSIEVGDYLQEVKPERGVE